MKRLIYIGTLLFLFTAGKVTAQAHLRVSALINWPDTAYNGQILPIGATVENIGTAAYQGPLQIVLRTDSNIFSYIYYNQITIFTLLPGDTLNFFPPGGYLFDSTVFRPGNNVVVVWPYTTQSINVDSTLESIFFINNTIQNTPEHPGIPNLKIYPNPSSDYTFISSPDIGLESVRIFNSTGQEILRQEGAASSRLTIQLSELPAGLYLLEILGSGFTRSSYRIIKQD